MTLDRRLADLVSDLATADVGEFGPQGSWPQLPPEVGRQAVAAANMFLDPAATPKQKANGREDASRLITNGIDSYVQASLKAGMDDNVGGGKFSDTDFAKKVGSFLGEAGKKAADKLQDAYLHSFNSTAFSNTAEVESARAELRQVVDSTLAARKQAEMVRGRSGGLVSGGVKSDEAASVPVAGAAKAVQRQ